MRCVPAAGMYCSYVSLTALLEDTQACLSLKLKNTIGGS